MQQEGNNVHIKVQCDNEFRRFVLTEVTYDNLATTIRTLLGFDAEVDFKLSYLDDEGDWVLLTCDSELEYAITLTKSPMRISVKLGSDDAVPAIALAPPHQLPCHFGKGNNETWKAWKEHKAWKCKGRGGRGGRGGFNKQAVFERFDAKINRLTNRHVALAAKLTESADLPEEKVRGMEWRLNHLQNKIDALKAKKQQKLQLFGVTENKQQHQINAMFQDIAQEEQQDALSTNDMETEEAAHPHSPHRHCGRGGGRGRGHLWGARGGFEHPHHPRGRWGHHHESHHEHHDGHHDHHEGHHEHHAGHHGEHHEGHFGAGCGRGGPAFLFAISTPEGKAAFERLQAARGAVMAARRSEREGGEGIQSEMEELKSAKMSWRETKKALWKEKCMAADAGEEQC